MNKNTIFIAVRHGDYDEDHNLSPYGKEQMEEVAQEIKKINTNGCRIVLLCSSAPRARQGGDIIIKTLGIPEELAIFDESLWDDNYHSYNPKKIGELIDEHFVDDTILLVLSHLDVVPLVTRYVASEKFGAQRQFGTSSYGSGYLIDCRHYSVFPP